MTRTDRAGEGQRHGHEEARHREVPQELDAERSDLGIGEPEGGQEEAGNGEEEDAEDGRQTETDPGGALTFKPAKLTAKAGKVTIDMTDPSSSGLQHGIAVEGNGVDKDGPIVTPGKVSTLTVSLKPGKYEFYCPFDSHKQQGMTGTLTVK